MKLKSLGIAFVAIIGALWVLTFILYNPPGSKSQVASSAPRILQPVWTATPLPTPTPNEIQATVLRDKTQGQLNNYSRSLIALLEEYKIAVGTFSGLMGQMNDETIRDPEWNILVLEQLEDIESIGSEIRQLSPPEIYRDIHIAFVETTDHFDNMSRNVRVGLERIQEGDTSLIMLELGLEEMKLGVEALDEVNLLIDELAREIDAR